MSQLVNFLTDKLIILYYPGFAGGKFLSNCLALSQFAVVQDPYLAELDLKFHDADFKQALDVTARSNYDKVALSDWPSYDDLINNIESIDIKKFETNFDFRVAIRTIRTLYCSTYYTFKKRAVMHSLPPDAFMHNWEKYEYGCKQFFGVNSFDYAHNAQLIESNVFNSVVPLISNSNRNFFIVTHDCSILEGILKKWPNAQIIQLINSIEFRKLASKLKQLEPIQTYEFDNIYKNAITFDVDSTYFNRNMFLSAMKNLYGVLGYNDFNVDDNLLEFYKAYMLLHDIAV